MRFSIIVPVYKVEKYIHKCVSTLIRQTYSDIEIILVDDGSPDSCPQICDAYAQSDDRIKVIHKANGGLSDARNAGLEIASGDYIIFVDSDDYIELDTCERLLNYAVTNSDILIADATVEGAYKELLHITPSHEVISGMEYLKRAFSAGRAPMVAWVNIYKRSFLEGNSLRFKCGILHEDEQFTPRALLRAESVIVTGINFYHYVIRDNSITTQNDKRRNAKDLYTTCCELEEIYRSINDKNLRKMMLDSLAAKYLNLTQEGKLFQYGSEYLHKDFILRNALLSRTRIKAMLFCLSPKLYYSINYLDKYIKNKIRKNKNNM